MVSFATYHLGKKVFTSQGRFQGSSRRWAPAYKFARFVEPCMELKKIWFVGGRASEAPPPHPLGSATASVFYSTFTKRSLCRREICNDKNCDPLMSQSWIQTRTKVRQAIISSFFPGKTGELCTSTLLHQLMGNLWDFCVITRNLGNISWQKSKVHLQGSGRGVLMGILHLNGFFFSKFPRICLTHRLIVSARRVSMS